MCVLLCLECIIMMMMMMIADQFEANTVLYTIQPSGCFCNLITLCTLAAYYLFGANCGSRLNHIRRTHTVQTDVAASGS